MGLGQSLLLSINPKASKLAAYDLFAFSFLFCLDSLSGFKNIAGRTGCF